MGNINNDPDGRMTVVQCCNGVCNAMVLEKKLLPGAYVEVDPNNAPAGYNAWFVVYADDIDRLEIFTSHLCSALRRKRPSKRKEKMTHGWITIKACLTSEN